MFIVLFRCAHLHYVHKSVGIYIIIIKIYYHLPQRILEIILIEFLICIINTIIFTSQDVSKYNLIINRHRVYFYSPYKILL